MRVAGDGLLFAAPSLMHHYVAARGYRPPDEFVAAVLAWDETAPRLSREELFSIASSTAGARSPGPT